MGSGPCRLAAGAADSGDASEVLDLCAAPGGKTMQLAAAGHRVTAVDSSESRLGRLRENLGRTHLDAELVEADALKWKPDRQYDAILLDAPCSATGTFRRHPEVLYRARPADHRRQRRAAGAGCSIAPPHWLKPGGTLVYSVCSLEPQEGEQAIRAFLDANSCNSAPSQRMAFRHSSRSLPKAGSASCPGLLEEQGGLDGFFMARLVRGG